MTRDDPFLIYRCGSQLCAVPVASVLETMRPLPIRAVSNPPPAVLGIAVIRGAPTPVLDAGVLLGLPAGAPSRFVTLRVGERSVALAVDAVIGLRSLSAATCAQLPPLLAHVPGPIAAVGIADEELLVVLHAARLVPEHVADLGGSSSAP